MLMLKGDKGKSKFLCNIIGKNLYFEYYDYPVNLGNYLNGFYMSSLNHSIDEFKDYIKACLYEKDKSYRDDVYDYLIIYTNESEEDLKDFISWLKDHEGSFLCRDVLIVCR